MGRQSPERTQSLCSCPDLAWWTEFTDSVPHSRIHLNDFSFIHSFANLFTKLFTHSSIPQALDTHCIHPSVHTHPYTYLHLLYTCKTPRGKVAGPARVTPTMWTAQDGFRLWGPKRSRGKGGRIEEAGNWQPGSGRSVPPTGPTLEGELQPQGSGGAVCPGQEQEEGIRLCSALRSVVQGTSLALRQTDGGSSHRPGHRRAGWLRAALNLSDPQCCHL